MKTYQPVRWPCYVWWKDELKPRRKYLLFGPRNQGERTASNYLGFLIVAKRGTPSWTIEQEKYECRYWVTHFWRLVDFFWMYVFQLAEYQWRLPAWAYFFVLRRYEKAAAHLARVECASRAQEIRAYLHESYAEIGIPIPPAQPLAWAHGYARSIHGAKNYPFIKAAGWTEEDVYNEIVKHL